MCFIVGFGVFIFFIPTHKKNSKINVLQTIPEKEQVMASKFRLLDVESRRLYISSELRRI